MPRRLLHEPHVLAHELRTPLSVLAGWYSLIRDGDISAASRPAEWAGAMQACQEAIDRLNLVISEACHEASALKRRQLPEHERFVELLRKTEAAINHSRQLCERLDSDHRRLPRPRQVIAATAVIPSAQVAPTVI
ncbi:MAG TPA: histidine kinase dimerization/phospho-acceptor domain-containing protein [Candidatus Limnocylindrales bacterium]|nr:histidine kinase dimerization/phospho-acceptor domain-containing protein [Candidatus Limnocylindrales bacterium]